MRIGIITFQRSISHGAFFQTYALAKHLKNLGHQVEVIDYHPRHRELNTKRLTPRWYGCHPQNFVNLWRNFVFKRAISHLLPLTERFYRTLDELQCSPPELDACICGSDQIWNPSHTGGGDSAYFCDFGGESLKRIGYAGSFGSSSVPKEFHPSLKNNLELLDSISSRESSGCKLIKEMSGKECTHVLDPSLLLSSEDYKSLLVGNRRKRTPYILVYNLQDSVLLRKVLDVVEATTSKQLIFVGENWKWWRYRGKCCFCGPEKWLDLVANSDAIVTSSFHGTAFAMIFKKPFISVGLTGGAMKKNTRMFDLLKRTGLGDRFIEDENALDQAKQLEESPDWAEVDKKLSVMKEKSSEFLKSALNLN